MTSSIKKWFAPPIFEDDEGKTRRASILNAILTTIAIYISLVILVELVDERIPASVIMMNAASVLLAFMLRHLLWRGKVNFVGSGVVILAFTWVTLVSVNMGTIRTPTTAAYVFVVILAGALFNWRGILVSTVASSLAVLGLILAENAGLLVKPDYTVTFTQWLTYTGLFGITGSIVYFTLEATRKALTRAEREIKAREQVQAALRESEEKFRSIVEYASSGILLTDEQGRIVEWNTAQENIFWVARKEALGQPFWDIQFRLAPSERQTPEVYENIKQLYHQIFTSGEIPEPIREMDVSFIRSDGMKRDIHYIVFSIKTQRGFRLAGISQDITERKKIEAELRTSEVRFHALFEQNHDGVLIFGLDGRTYEANQRAADMLGYPLEEIRKGKDREFFAANSQSENSFARVLAGEHLPLFERTFTKKDGRVFPVEINIELVRDKDGNPLHVQSIVRDITQRKQVEDTLRQQNEYLSNLHQITLDLLSRKETQVLLNNIAQYAASLVNAQHGYIFLPEDNVLVLRAATEGFAYNIGKREPKPGVGVLGHVWQSMEPVVVENYGEWIFRDPNYKSENLRAIAGVPIKIGDKIIGVLEVANTETPHTFTQEELQILTRFATLTALVLNNAQLLDSTEHEVSERKQKEVILQRHVSQIEQFQQELREQAIRDPLTGLYNRRYLNEALTREIVRAARINIPLSVLVSDIDHFKKLNDTHGHQAGDKFLVEIATLIKEHARGSDIVCRYGGEEFLLVLPETTAEAAAKRAEELRQQCAKLIIQYEGMELSTTISFGVASYPNHGQEAEEIIIKADKAMYQSKHNGRNRVTIWEG